MNYALLVYRCAGEYLYCCEEYETCVEVEERIQELERDQEQSFTYHVYGESLTVKITPPSDAVVSVF